MYNSRGHEKPPEDGTWMPKHVGACISIRQVSPFLQATKALRESSGIALLCLQTSALGGGEGSASRPGRFTPGKDPVSIVKEAGWAPGPVWTGPENLAPTGIRSPDRPARSQSLYRLSYRAHCVSKKGLITVHSVGLLYSISGLPFIFYHES
jgi:hypothetical protein